jgi:hypothetical protein
MARNIAQADAALKAGQCFFGATSSSFVEK